MQRKMIHPKRLTYFAEVFKLGSISAAADRLNMVQAGIGRQIEMLEKELGVLLFERGKRGRGMVPTEAAQILYGHYGRYCDWQEKMTAAVLREPTEEAAKEQVINAKRLFYFSEVFKRGSINTVADHLNMVQAGIGRQIQRLEEELGVRLFERGTNGRGMVTGGHGRGMVPTEAAETLYGFYHQYCDWQDKLEAAIEEWRSMKRGEIVIAIPSPYIDGLIEETFTNFYHAHPSLSISIKAIDNASQVIAEILEDKVHMGIIHCYDAAPDIRCHARARLPMCALVNQHHPLNKKKRTEFAEVARYPFCLPPPSYDIWRVFHQMARSEKVELTSPFIIDSAVSRKKAAVTGCGGVFMSTIAARQEIEAKQLVPIAVNHPFFTDMEVCLIVRQGRLLSPAANRLLNLIKCKSSIFTEHTFSPVSKDKPSVSLPNVIAPYSC